MRYCYNEDCFKLMAAMPDNCVDMVLTDIPYGGEVSGFKECGFQPRVNRPGADGLFDTERFTREIIRICRGNFLIFCGNKQMGIIRSVFDSMRPKVQMFRTINWEKTNVSPMNGQHFFLNSNEFAAAFRKPKAYWGGHCVHTNFIYKCPHLKGYPTPKPVGLLKQFIGLMCPPDGIVFDPVAGSFATAIAAHETDRHFICNELNPDYYFGAMARLVEAGVTGAEERQLPSQSEMPKQFATDTYVEARPIPIDERRLLIQADFEQIVFD